jgi:RecB family exonuclease
MWLAELTSRIIATMPARRGNVYETTIQALATAVVAAAASASVSAGTNTLRIAQWEAARPGS